MKIDVVPIVRELDLGEYSPIYAGKSVQVWVNAPNEFLRRRDELLVEYSRHWNELRRLRLEAVQGTTQGFSLVKLLPRRLTPRGARRSLDARSGGRSDPAEAPDADQALADRFNTWVSEEFLPAVHAWFSELLSKGSEENSLSHAEIDTIYANDTVLLEWIKRRSLEMVQAYAAEKKTSSGRPSSA